MKKPARLLILLSVVVLTVLLFFQLPLPFFDADDYPVFHKAATSDDTGREIIFLSDTQEPVWVETIVLDRNRNLEARDMIFRDILTSNPALLIHLGDMVAFGYKDADWKPIDHYLNMMLQKDIEVYPTMGNHELEIFSSAGEKKFMNRFPFYSKTGYSIRNGSTEIILLNSNFSDLTAEEIEKQNVWYRHTLDSLDRDSTVTAVIVGVHHPPFTNSTVVDPGEEVQEYFVDPFIGSSKCRVFMSGHCHAFEHFRHRGKDFLVLGGGGGLQQPLYVGAEAKWEDQYDSETPLRMFHYLKFESENDTLRITLRMLSEDFSGFEDCYEIRIPEGGTTGNS